MKKTVLFLCLFVFGFANAQSDKFWNETALKPGMQKHTNVTRENFPTEFKLYQLNVETMKQVLYTAPDRMDIGERGVIITMPDANGKLERFEMFEASNFDAELQAQFPAIRAYAGIGLDDKTAQIRLSFGINSLQTMTFRSDRSTEFMEPYSQDATIYAVYSKKNVQQKTAFTCSTVYEQNLVSDLGRSMENVALSSNPNLRTFRLALSCTAEYSNYFGATSPANVGLVLTAFNNTMTRVNGVNNRDFAIHMNIVAASTNVIYYNPATDPYSDGDFGSSGIWNTELQNNLSSNLTGLGTSLASNNAAYDIGHLFGASGGGGNAGCIGCICVDDTSSTSDKKKGSAYTSPANGIPAGDNFDIDYVAHEIGHQLGANHTFTHTTEDNPVNYEPGSGSTIMGYAGITNKNVQSHSDAYFHAGSIEQVQTNMASKTCAVSTPLTHGVPVVNAGINYTIPKSTPFKLTGSATDTGGGALSYTWEQVDDAVGPSNLCSISNISAGDLDCVPVASKTDGPLFRSYLPTSSPSRVFPTLQSVLDGKPNTVGNDINVEYLPSVGRTLKFRLTVRDNSVVGGGGLTNFGNTSVFVSGSKLALTVNYPATSNSVVFPIASTQTVTWTGAVGVTGHSTITGGSNVDVLLSTDGGQTFPYVLISNTPNDGSQAVTLPTGVSGADCRFMVKASENIFFNISKPFAVGNYVYELQNVCTDYTFNLNTPITESDDDSFPGYSFPIADSYTISDANFYANVTHPSIGQVGILLMAPWQTTLNTGLWYNNVACTGANLDKWFDNSGSAVNCAATNGAPAFLPYSGANIAAYNGNNSAGAWKLYFKDNVVDSNAGAATFNIFTIQLCKSVPVAVLSSDSFGINDLVLYPNPNKGNFNIQFTSDSGNEIKVNVHDMSGREIFKKAYVNNGLFDESLQLHNAQAGIYLVTIQDGTKKEVKKIVVE